MWNSQSARWPEGGAACAWLMPLAELLQTERLSRPVLHADETPLQILNTKKVGKAQNGYLWAYVSVVNVSSPERYRKIFIILF